jgi:hypothetical protein
MTASDKSFVGLAKQTAKGTPNVTDTDFTYILFTQGGLSPAPVNLPLEQEIGGGAMLRDVQKVGIMSGGRFSFTPRPKSLGYAFLGVTGSVATVDNLDGSYAHTFKLGTDQFSAPYWTGRQDMGGLHGEQLQDLRFNSLALAWRGARFVTAEMGLVGGLPTPLVTTTWGALSKVDSGPQFIAPLGTIELPSATALKVIAGSFIASSAIPLDEQWIVGSYSPDDFSIVQRAFALQMAVKIEAGELYRQMMYDPAGGSAWVAEVMREADFNLSFDSPVEAADGVPHSFSIAANGESGANANVTWTCQPVVLSAGKQIILNITGTFLADPLAGDPITLTLVNDVAAY